MNKQEIIKKLESIKAIGNDAIAACYNESMNAGITLMKKLDEPQKPVVPKFVAEWFEENKDDLEFPIWELCVDSYGSKDEHGMLNWIQQSENNPIETLIRMKDGYEVEKESLYYVKLKIPGATYYLIQTFLMPGDTHMCFSAATERYGAKWKNTFTEAEIKEIDERFWPFAVPVEEVAEG